MFILVVQHKTRRENMSMTNTQNTSDKTDVTRLEPLGHHIFHASFRERTVFATTNNKPQPQPQVHIQQTHRHTKTKTEQKAKGRIIANAKNNKTEHIAGGQERYGHREVPRMTVTNTKNYCQDTCPTRPTSYTKSAHDDYTLDLRRVHSSF